MKGVPSLSNILLLSSHHMYAVVTYQQKKKKICTQLLEISIEGRREVLNLVSSINYGDSSASSRLRKCKVHLV